MLTKTDPDEIQSYLSDASYLRGGHADEVVWPETAEDVASILARASSTRTPVTVSGAGTGTVAGRVAFGGIVLATDKLNKIESIVSDGDGTGHATVQAGVVLADLQRAADSKGLLYPPDPTENSSFIGGNVATNASGSRTFKYGPTRNYVERLRIALSTGELLNLRRGDLRAKIDGSIAIPLANGKSLSARLPSYHMPHTRKNASGYFIAPEMDVLDLFIGSEGTLGVIVEVETRLLPKPEGLLSGVVFFESESNVLSFVVAARQRSFDHRCVGATHKLDARALEFFDVESLRFLREKYSTIPASAVGAIFFEQETNSGNEDELLGEWQELLDAHNALSDSWFATNEQDHLKLREFRHQLPVLMNEWFAKYQQRKVSTDMAVPDEEFEGLFRVYRDTLRPSGLRHTIFGHIGDNHLHVNILPRNDEEGARARDIYIGFLKYAAAHGGTLSAEHGVGKLKRDYLRLFYTENNLREMAALKHAFDPAGILGRGNIFDQVYLELK